MKLKEVAFLRTGLVLNRKQVKPTDVEKFKYKQLTLKSINNDEVINENYLEEFISNENLKEEYFTHKNDVIVRLSYPYTAIIIDEQTEGLLVPSHFVIIRCDLEKIIPGYLQCILNSNEIHKQISLSTSTSMIGTIRPLFFSELEIKIISLEKQKKLAEINRLCKEEIILLTRLKEEKQKYNSLLIKKIQKEMEK